MYNTSQLLAAMHDSSLTFVLFTRILPYFEFLLLSPKAKQFRHRTSMFSSYAQVRLKIVKINIFDTNLASEKELVRYLNRNARLSGLVSLVSRTSGAEID